MTQPMQEYLADKNGFFTNVINQQQADQLAAQKRYEFVAFHHQIIRQEFDLLSDLLKNVRDEHKRFQLYRDYLKQLLKNYYEAYGNTKERLRLEKSDAAATEEHNQPIEHQPVKKKLMSALTALMTIPLHTTDIRDALGLINITRIQIVLCRLTVKQSLLVADAYRLLQPLTESIGLGTDINSMLAILNKPSPLFNALSVTVPLSRLIINSGLLLKHTLFPSEQETSLSINERFTMEMNKRFCDLLNDMVWTPINAITNYNNYFGLSAFAASWILAAFLCFDIGLLMYRHHLAYQQYLSNRSCYLESSRGLVDNEAAFGQRQLAALDQNWQVMSAVYRFNITAAALLVSGFSASLLITVPLLVPLCFFLSAIGVSMYITAPSYGQYYQKWLELQTCTDDEQRQEALHQTSMAKNNFMSNLTKNTLVPMIVMLVIATSLMAAILIATTYISYEIAIAIVDDQSEDIALSVIPS
ncbi:MAG: hypothetical protein ACOVQX_05850 [Legionella sp.]